MPDYDLGTATGKIKIDASGAVTGAAQANAAMDSVDKGSRNAAAGSKILGTAMIGIGGAAIAGFGLAINTAANFEKQMSAVEAVSGATEEQMEAVRKKALQLGADTAFSAGEAGQAMEELVKAGIDVDDVLNGAADAVVALAAAGEVDLPTAAAIAANAMNQFNLAASDMVHIADLIAGAANASAIDVNDFGLSMQQAGATANLVGLSFDDLAVAIVAMGNAGIKGSDAGTSLKSFLANLQPTTEKQTALMKELGLVTEDGANQFFDATGKIKSMSEISGVLNTALSGMTEQQKAFTLEVLFGSDAIRAAAVISNQGADGINHLTAEMGKTTAADVAATRMDNFSGSMEQLKGSLETLAITVGTPFLGFLRNVVDHLTDWVNALGSVNPETLKWVSYVTLASAALLTLGGAVILANRYIAALEVALGPVAAAIGAIGLTAAVIIAIVLALAAGIFLLYQHNQKFRDIVKQVGEALKDAWQWVIDNVWPVLQDIAAILINDVVPALQDFWHEVVNVGKIVGKWLQDHVFNTFFALGELIVGVVDRIIRVVNFLFPAFRFAFNQVIAIVRAALDILEGAISFWVGFVETIWRNFGDNILEHLRIVWEAIKLIIETVLDIIRGVIQVFTGIVTGDWSKAWEGIKTIGEAIWNAIQGGFQLFIDFIKNLWDAWLSLLRTVWETAWNGIRTFIETILNTIKNFFSSTINNILGFFTEMPGKIKGSFGIALDTLLQIGKDILQGLYNGVKEVWERFKTWFFKLPQTLIDSIPDPLKMLFDIGKKIIQGLIDGMKSMIGSVKDAVGNITSSITSHFPNSPRAKVGELKIRPPESWGQSIGTLLIEGLSSSLPRLRDMLGTITSDISSLGSVDMFGAASSGNTNGGDNFNFSFTFGDLTTPETATAVKAAVTSDDTIQALVRAARAGRR